MRKFLPTLFLLFSVLIAISQIPHSSTFDDLKFRFIGPEGNRAIAIAGVPGNPMINYIGAASGGLWKTSDGGINWKPIFDDQSVSSIGSIAIAETDPEDIWVGTGETFVIRPAHAMGDGIYNSKDGGETWSKKGLEKTGRIGRVVIHPSNKDIIYAAALGHTYGNQKERGVYRTKDGGKTWDQVLFIDEGTGAADIAIDPKNPSILYAAMWSVNINTWGLNSGGQGGGIYKSTDGGDTWQAMSEKGLPGGMERPVGKTAVALCHSNPNVVYALFEINSPELWRSNDGGETWELKSQNHTMNERAPYYTRISVAPDNPEEIYFLSVRFSKSEDGGKTLMKRPPRGGGDNHDMWIDHKNPDRLLVAHDGCASLSLNRGRSFNRIVLPIAQMYHVSTDQQIPYNVYGNRQDGWSYKGPSNSLQGYIPVGLWHGVGGCESGFAKADPNDNNIVWSGCYDGGLERYDLTTGYAREVRVWPEAGYGWAPADLKYRWHWNFPLSFSPHAKHRVYVGSQFVHQSDDGGQSWQVISPDLTLNRKDHQQNSGGVAIDNLMTFDGSVLFSIEESKLEKGLIWVGSNDGQVNITKDGGKNWTNVTSNIPDLPEWGTIANFEPSRYDPASAYISVDLHQMGDFDPYIYKTEDYGKSWRKISNTIPKAVHSFVHVVREDPKMKGMLYCGVDNGIFVTYNDGKEWFPLKSNLPPAPVYWLEIQEEFDDLVVATYGRGFYILDNIGALRNYNAEIKTKEISLLPSRNAYRFNQKESIKTDGPSLNSGRNPSYGAEIDYFLSDTLLENPVVQILDKDGKLVRTLKSKNLKGINRLNWDLRYEPTDKPKLMTQPPGRPWVELNGEGWRPLVTWDLDLWRGQLGPRVAPGDYTIKFVAGETLLTQTLTVLKDPNAKGSQEEIEEQVDLLLDLRDAMNTAVGMINDVELIRAQLNKIIPELRSSNNKQEAIRLQKIADEVASGLYDIHLTGAREDAFRSPMKLYGRLSALASDLNGSGIDFSPTDQQEEVAEVLDGRLVTIQKIFSDLVGVEIRNFNEKLENASLKVKLPLKP